MRWLVVLVAGSVVGCTLTAGGGGAGADAASADASTAPDAAALCDPATCASLRVVKTVGSSGRDFATMTEWQAARKGKLITRSVLVVEAGTGQFEAGETVSATGCSGVFIPEGASPGSTLTLDDLTGDCTPGALLVGETSGASATLVGYFAVGTIEVGELYADSVFAESVAIAGSTTDADHHMVLTVAASDRHTGVAGTGVVIDPVAPDHAIHIADAFTVVEWVEVTDWHTESTGSFDGINVQADQVLIQNVIVHDDGHGIEPNSDAGGIQLSSDNLAVTVRNSVVYNTARMGIGLHGSANSTLDVENCTVLRCNQADNSPNSYGCIAISGGDASSNTGSVLTVTNSIAFDGGGSGGVFRVSGDAAFGPETTNNASSDATAPGTDPTISLVSAGQLVSADPGTEDLHLADGAAAIGAGTNLSAKFAIDIEGDARPAEPDAWDVGADQRTP